MRRREAQQWWRLVRDVATFAVGAGLAIHEAVRSEPQPGLLAIYVTMMGLPAVFRMDEHGKQGPTDEELDEFDRRFEQQPGSGVTRPRSSGSPPQRRRKSP